MAHLTQRGWGGLPDRDWIARATERGFVIVSGDRNERTRGYTVSDLKEMQARVLLLARFWDHLSRWERAKWLVAHIERLVEVAQQMPTGSVYLIYKRGHYKVL
jgi:hypothetical protein